MARGFHDEYDDADYAKRKWGFKSISNFQNLSKIEKTNLVSHNMNILKNLPTEIKTTLIKKCIENKSNDYLGINYLEFYDPCCKQLVTNQENHHIVKQDDKRRCAKKKSYIEFDDTYEEEEEEKDWTPPKKKSTRLVPELPKEIKGKIRVQENYVVGQNSRTSDHKKRSRVEVVDSEEEEIMPCSKKRGNESSRPVISKLVIQELTEEIKGSIGEQENHVVRQDSRKTNIRNNNIRVETNDHEEKEEEKKKAKVVRIRPVPVPVPDVMPELPEEIKAKIDELNGSEIKLVYTKRLFKSDVDKQLTRLSMPANQIDISFLRNDEMEVLDRKLGVEVGLVGPTGKLSSLELKKWDMAKNSGKVNIVYNLVSGWYKNVVADNGLEKGHLVHVWSFRESTKLWFAVIKVDE